MSVHHSTFNSVANTNYDSVVSVVEDLISDRSVWRKLVCLLLCITFLMNAWAVIILHLVSYTNETVLEATVSIAVLVAGQYVGTGIVNGFIYWRRWNKTSVKSRAREQEQNKEAWVCMRITLTLLGLAPVGRYIESLVVIHRMLALEKQYMSETVALIRETKQPSSLPTGSLISGPSVSVRQSGIARSTTNSTPVSASRIKELDAGIAKVYKVRRQFRRTEQDAGMIALASGVLGAGPFLISQGVLYFRRVGMNFLMPTATWLGILVCSITGIIWICAALTHFYPAPYNQSEFDFDRGLGQVHIGGLIILFFAHLIHVSIRCGSLVLFTGQFYWVVLGVLSFHYAFVLICLITSRACTGADYTSPVQLERSSVWGNIVSDIMFAYVSIFEFTNAYAKYTRTRYMLYYLFYYLENSAMVGAWYAYFTYPKMWYYLPSLLVVTLAQFLGFVLLQVYLYLFSKSRRKRTICGICFTHLEQPAHVHFGPAENVHKSEQSEIRRNEAQSVVGAPSVSILSARTNSTNVMVKKSPTGLYDPVFGEKIAQTAIPKSRRKDRLKREHLNTTTQETAHNTNRIRSSMTVGQSEEGFSQEIPEWEKRRTETHWSSNQIRKYPSYADLMYQQELASSTEHMLKHSSSGILPISPEEKVEREISARPIKTLHRPRDSRRTSEQYSSLPRVGIQPDNSQAPWNAYRAGTDTQNTRPVKNVSKMISEKGVFKPRPDQNWSRQRWPYGVRSRGQPSLP